MLTHLLYVIKHIEVFLFKHILLYLHIFHTLLVKHFVHVMSQTYIVIFLPNLYCCTSYKNQYTVNNIIIQQNAI